MPSKNFDYSEYVGVGHNKPTDVPEITKLAEKQHAAQIKVDKIEAELKTANEELKELCEKLLPDAMDRAGLTTYGTTTGISVEVQEKIRASLAVENRPKGFAWLEENGFGGIIKSNVVVAFKRDELEEATELVDRIRSEEQRPANLDRKVEPATLTAFVKEQLEQGKELPLDIFGVFRQRIAKVEI